MKALLCIFILMFCGQAAAQSLVTIDVFKIGPFGGALIDAKYLSPPTSRTALHAALGPAVRQWHRADVWEWSTKIVIAYYDADNNAVSFILLPTGPW